MGDIPFAPTVEIGLGGLVDVGITVAHDLEKAGFSAHTSISRQLLATAEESGEFVGAVRRYLNWARRKGSWEEVEEEWADVLITHMVTARTLGMTPGGIQRILTDKLNKIYTRGFRE